MWRKRFDPSEVPEYIPGKQYSARELDLMAEKMLRDDARRERCRECEANYTDLEDVPIGEPTGHFVVKEQFNKEGNPLLDESGRQLKIKFPEYICPNNHKWFKGEGRAKGIGGRNSILFEEHIIQRKRREIMNEAGVPDPSIVQGNYNKSHPQGRRVNDSERRAKGASFYS